jgi:NAD(P)-dependent dehydrogenase (short-subunit alcohol dehydrogenase family)
VNDLVGKVAVVTGAASGIGRAIAERLGKEDMKTVLADIDARALALAERDLAASGIDVAGSETDVSQHEDVDALVRFVLQRFSAVHVLCNNAGVAIGGRLWEHPLEDWEWLMGVNTWGVVHGIRSFVPVMLAQGDDCHIVNTASAAGLEATPYLGIYSATKYAVVAMSEALQQELVQSGARVGVSVLCPGVVNTRIADSERNRPDRLGNAVHSSSPDLQPSRQAFQAALACGMAPEQVADAVVDAIKTSRFYVLTHNETEARVRARFDRIMRDAAVNSRS